MNQESEFYDSLIDCTVRVYLIPGIKLQGTLLGSCEHAIFLLDQEGQPQLLYKHSITTVAEDIDDRSSQRPSGRRRMSTAD